MPDPRHVDLADCKSMYFGLGCPAKSTHCGLVCAPSPGALGLATMPDPRHMDLVDCQVYILWTWLVIWVWQTCLIHIYLGLTNMLDSHYYRLG